MQHTTTRRGNTQINRVGQVVPDNKIIPELVSGSSTQAVTQQPALKMPGPRIKTVRGGTSGNVPVRQLSYFTFRGFTLRPSLPSSVGMRGIGAAPALYAALQACGMTKRSVRGFTLIELLVIVLIIGILAAVALPQYNKAVKKAQGAEALMAFDIYNKAMAAYYLEHGTYGGITADTLGVQMPILKHFKYTNNGPRSFNFQTGSTSTNQTDSYSMLYMEHITDSISVGAVWQNGNLNFLRCVNAKCGEYFNCNWKSRNAYPGDVERLCYLQ